MTVEGLRLCLYRPSLVPDYQGYVSARNILRNNGLILNKARKLNFYPPDGLSIEEL